MQKRCLFLPPCNSVLCKVADASHVLNDSHHTAALPPGCCFSVRCFLLRWVVCVCMCGLKPGNPMVLMVCTWGAQGKMAWSVQTTLQSTTHPVSPKLTTTQAFCSSPLHMNTPSTLGTSGMVRGRAGYYEVVGSERWGTGGARKLVSGCHKWGGGKREVG